MGTSMNILGWISMLVGVAIAGMGGAPIAEYFGFIWLMHALVWMSYIALFLLSIATLVVGGLGLYHGYLTVIGQSPGTISGHKVLPNTIVPVEPEVEEIKNPKA
ncbi:MAG: hypothetical protein QGI45_11355 [Myxococcota bacterium]|jgi:hypothetical protein|nr:hypothetical protein [Myxococcota bacterium]